MHGSIALGDGFRAAHSLGQWLRRMRLLCTRQSLNGSESGCVENWIQI